MKTLLSTSIVAVLLNSGSLLACPDSGDDLKLPGSSFAKDVKIHVDRRVTRGDVKHSHLMIAGSGLTGDGSWLKATKLIIWRMAAHLR